MARNKRVPPSRIRGKLWRVDALPHDTSTDRALQTRAYISGRIVWVTVARGDLEVLHDIAEALNAHGTRIFELKPFEDDAVLDEDQQFMRAVEDSLKRRRRKLQ